MMKPIMKTLLLVAVFATFTVAPAQVVVNECFTGVPDWCEVINLGSSAVNIGGWTLSMADDPQTTAVFTFPANTTLQPNEIAVVTESATGPSVPAGVQLFLVASNINWAGPSSPNDPEGATALNDGAGAGVDLVLFGAPSNIPPQSPASPFSGSLTVSDLYARNSMVDTDTAADWTGSAGSGTPGALNPGQSTTPMPPTAGFVASASSVPLGGTVQFTDTSANAPTSWAWDLDGDGTTDSTSQNPTFTYNSLGSYDVTLSVTNAQGSDSITQAGLINVVANVAVSIPHTENFDSGSLGGEWTTATSSSSGRIRLFTDGNASPLSGGDALAMDSSVNGTFSTNTATLLVDCAATGGGILKYYARETADETHAEDGLFLSDGINSVKVVDHSTLTSSWTEIVVDITIEAQAAGLALNSNFEVIFSQRDNYEIPTDGVFIDDVRLYPPPVPDTGQANQAKASLDINAGVNLNGHLPVLGENGPFFASGNQLNLTVGGNPNQPFVLLMGALNRTNYVLMPGQNLDIGMLGGSVNFSDIDILLDGATGVGFFDPFARIDGSGSVGLTFGMESFPPGVFGTLQAVVFTGDASVIGLTAAFEFTVSP